MPTPHSGGLPLVSPALRSIAPALCTHSWRSALVFSRCTRPFPDGSVTASMFQRRRIEDAAICWTRGVLVPKALDSVADHHAKGPVNKRKVVEHIYLIKAKPNLSEAEEKDMLDYLYTSQYQMRGILAISLGRIEETDADGFTHAVFMRFQEKEDLTKFYCNSYYLGVLKDHVIPYCYESISVDYESEVDDDILPIFRRGEEFNSGVEFVLLISVLQNVLGDAVEDALVTLAQLIEEFQPLIVQATLDYEYATHFPGSNLNSVDNGYTHGAVIRFPSLEALKIFRGCSQFKDIWRWKFHPIIAKSLAIHYSVDPVGTEMM